MKSLGVAARCLIAIGALAILSLGPSCRSNHAEIEDRIQSGAQDSTFDESKTESDNPEDKAKANPAVENSLQFDGDSFGRYVGTLQHSLIDFDQLATLDFIVGRTDTGGLQLKAVLKLQFGDFSGPEYVSYHFDQVTYEVLTGKLTFDQADQELTLHNGKIENGKLTIQARSNSLGDVGILVLEKNGSANPARTLVAQIHGEYNGLCDNQATNLHLWTFRNTAETIRLGNVFGAYEIKGNVVLSDSCNNETAGCVAEQISSGSYNFFAGALELFADRHAYTCRVNAVGLDCGSCQFTRTGNQQGDNPVLKPLTAKNQILATSDEEKSENPQVLSGETSAIAGLYQGYLHHERLDTYQAAQLNIVTYQGVDQTTVRAFKMSATASLHFGGHDSLERLDYRFEAQPYNLLHPQFTFERVVDDVDAILQVVELKNGVVRGVWFSLQFGRVGTFELRKELQSIAEIKVLKPLQGIYDSSNGFELYLDIRRDATPISSLNPYFPLTMGGYLALSDGSSPRITVTGGSYDFYVGKLGIITKQKDQVLVGKRGESGLELFKPANGILRQEPPSSPYNFTLRP